MTADNLDSWLKKNLPPGEPAKAQPPKRVFGKPPFNKPHRQPQHAQIKPLNQNNLQGREVAPRPKDERILEARGQHGFRHGRFFKRADGNKPQQNFRAGGRPMLRNFRPKADSALPGTPPVQHPVASHRVGHLRIIPLGGLDEVGKNMMVVEYGNDIVIIDMGFQFPEEEMLGVDYVIPDASYLKGKEHRIRGVLITHGHLDHIGGIPYLIDKLGSPPIYATRLTLELIRKRNAEFALKNKPKMYEVDSRSRIRLGAMTAEFFRVNHSIPDCVGVYLETPCGGIVHTGDFKFDFTPADGIAADIDKMKLLGTKNVLVLCSESTNALLPGHSTSELKICGNIDELIRTAPHRMIIASFSSLIGRIQHIINSAAKYNRRIYVSGRSMESNIDIAKKLGYLKLPPGIELHRMKKGGRHNEDDVLILTTGSQGEDISALTRMAHGEHAHIKIRGGDTVIISAQPIIGNERAITRVMNELAKRGARVISNQTVNVHISGHGKQEDLKAMMNLIKPRFLIPIHGEYYMRMAHKELGVSMGIAAENILLINNGTVVESDGKQMSISTDERAESKYILVEGPDMGSEHGMEVLSERQILAQNGVVIVMLKMRKRQLIGAPEVISRGFIFRRESAEILKEIGQRAKESYWNLVKKDPKANYQDVKLFTRSRLDTYIHSITEKRPLIVPMIIEV